jgi:hypothetical protein
MAYDLYELSGLDFVTAFDQNLREHDPQCIGEFWGEDRSRVFRGPQRGAQFLLGSGIVARLIQCRHSVSVRSRIAWIL